MTAETASIARTPGCVELMMLRSCQTISVTNAARPATRPMIEPVVGRSGSGMRA